MRWLLGVCVALIGASLVVRARAGARAGFDAARFLRAAKRNFLKLRGTSDAGRLHEIREVLALEAALLELATENGRHCASVRFSGRMREAPGDAPAKFEEVWNLVKPVDGSSGWLLAGIQQMH